MFGMKSKEKEAKKAKPVPEKKIKEAKPPPRRNMRMLVVMKNIVVVCFLFFAVLGVVSIILMATRGDGTQELRDEIRETSLSMQSRVSVYTEAEAFAQNFVRAYFTYGNRDANDYQRRLQEYCTPQLAGEIVESISLQDMATAVYVQAIDTAEYGADQYDITVIADVLFTKKITSRENGAAGEPPEVTESVTRSTLFVVVPVWSDGQGKYIVEDIPRLIAPPDIAVYQRQEYSASTAETSDKAAAQQMLTDFFNTLYTEPQNKIDYYLSENADKSKFTALDLNGVFQFERIDQLSLYSQSNPNEFLALVTIRITDPNGTAYRQRFNVSLVRNDKFYAKDINLRTYNLKS